MIYKKKQRWYAELNGLVRKFNTEEEALDFLGLTPVEELIEEEAPSQQEFKWKPWEK